LRQLGEILGAAPGSAVIMMTMAEDVDGVARAVSSGAVVTSSRMPP
jgi:hypothetical protein